MDSTLFSHLLKRMGTDHARQRLKLQAMHSAVRFGTRGHHFFPENLDSLGPLVKFFFEGVRTLELSFTNLASLPIGRADREARSSADSL